MCLGTAFMELRNDADMCDVTIATDEDSVAAHKLVLSACSPQLKEMIRKHIRLSGSSGQQVCQSAHFLARALLQISGTFTSVHKFFTTLENITYTN